MIHNREAAAAWWRSLQSDPERGQAGDRAALARLRRCATVVEAMQEPATIVLFRACGADRPDDLVTVALAAAVLAHLRQDGPEQSVARQVGQQTGSEALKPALMKPLRFQRLMAAATPDERLAAMRRLVALAGGKLNLRDLCAALFDWTEWRRIRWTYDYWDAGQPAAPDRPTNMPGKDTAA